MQTETGLQTTSINGKVFWHVWHVLLFYYDKTLKKVRATIAQCVCHTSLHATSPHYTLRNILQCFHKHICKTLQRPSKASLQSVFFLSFFHPMSTAPLYNMCFQQIFLQHMTAPLFNKYLFKTSSLHCNTSPQKVKSRNNWSFQHVCTTCLFSKPFEHFFGAQNVYSRSNMSN